MRRLAEILFVICLPVLIFSQRLQPPRQFYQTNDEEDDEEPVPDILSEEDLEFSNKSERGLYLGAPCEFTCSPRLHHVFCNPASGQCECEENYPVKIHPATGCGKPKKLGEQCLYRQSCIYSDQFSSCIQVHHNAICQCKDGYHLVSLQRGNKRVFCAEDLVLLTSDFSALAGVATGIAVLAGLICFVLRLFTQNRSPTPHHFANANLGPPILFASDTGIPLTVHSSGGRSTSRASSQKTFVSTYSRRVSSAQGYHQGGRGVVVSASRAGSRRPSLASVHSSGSSIRSYSARRFEREREQKEEREMQLKLNKMQSISGSLSNRLPTPSPQSTDELLNRQVPLAIEEECAGTSFQNNLGPSTSKDFH